MSDITLFALDSLVIVQVGWDQGQQTTFFTDPDFSRSVWHDDTTLERRLFCLPPPRATDNCCLTLRKPVVDPEGGEQGRR